MLNWSSRCQGRLSSRRKYPWKGESAGGARNALFSDEKDSNAERREAGARFRPHRFQNNWQLVVGRRFVLSTERELKSLIADGNAQNIVCRLFILTEKDGALNFTARGDRLLLQSIVPYPL